MAKAKRNIFLKAAGLILGATMLATYVFSGTMAQYKSSGTASEVAATVGKWDIVIAGAEGSDSPDQHLTGMININLHDMGVYSTGAQAKNEAYTNEGQDGTELAPVPGTYGYKELTIRNDSVVDAVVTVSLDGTNTDQGITVGVLENPPTGDPIESSTNLSQTGVTITPGSSKNVYIGYNWAFEGNDTDDTELGSREGSIDFGNITITATQAKYQAPQE